MSLGILQPSPPRIALRGYDSDLDDITSVLVDICEALEDAGAVAFNVSGFGDEAWPLRSNPDLAIFLEQLPQAIKAVEDAKEFTIDFFEQGVQRELIFTPHSNEFIVNCRSGTSWQPNGTEQISRTALLDMLIELRTRFIKLALTLAPDLAMNSWFRKWTALNSPPALSS